MTVRLYDTATRSLVALPDPPAKVGMYVCGPTVYQRAHIGNAVPFVIFAWLRNWLRERGYDVTYVHNITDVNDKIYEAAPGASAARAREATAWYLEDTASFGLEMPDEQPLATETIPEIVALIEELIAAGHAYEAGGDVYFRVASFATYGALSGQRPDQVEEQEPSPLKEDPRDFALWKATKEGEDTSWESPWGPGRPGWHIECSAMAEKTLGPEFLDPRRRARPRLSAPRERAGAVAGRRAPVREDLDAQRAAPVRRREDVEVGRQRRHDPGRDRRVGARGGVALPDDGPLAQAARVLARGDDGRRRPGREPAQRAAWRRSRSSGDWDAFATVLDDDFNTPAALAVLHRWAREGALDELRRGLAVFGLGGLGDSVEAPAAVVGARPRALGGADGARLRRVGSAARRDHGRRLGGAGRARRARRLRARAAS